jgi:hypothetical protein
MNVVAMSFAYSIDEVGLDEARRIAFQAGGSSNDPGPQHDEHGSRRRRSTRLPSRRGPCRIIIFEVSAAQTGGIVAFDIAGRLDQHAGQTQRGKIWSD